VKTHPKEVMTFARAAEILAGRASVKIAPNTHLVRVDERTYAVRLYGTDVVMIRNEGDWPWTLDSGGHRTRTTIDRINRYSPATVYQRGGNWYLDDDTPYRDGMSVDRLGLSCGA
jgi:hypothetical protein